MKDSRNTLSKEGLNYLLKITGLPDGSNYQEILNYKPGLSEFASMDETLIISKVQEDCLKQVIDTIKTYNIDLRNCRDETDEEVIKFGEAIEINFSETKKMYHQFRELREKIQDEHKKINETIRLIKKEINESGLKDHHKNIVKFSESIVKINNILENDN